MKHKTLSLYVPCLEGGYEDAGRVDLESCTLISDERLCDLEAAEKDAIEQARLNGIGAERELALMAKLEAAEKNNSDWLYANAPGGWIDNLRIENDALRAKVERMEQQEQARLVTPTAYRWRYRGAIKWQYGELTEEGARLAKEHNHEVQPLYALPGAKGE